MIIRRASPADVPAAAHVVAEAWKWAYQGIVPDDVMGAVTDEAATTERIVHHWNDDRILLVAEHLGQIMGFVSERMPPSLEGYDAEIGSLYVHPSAARLGLGRSLVHAMCEHLGARGCGSLCIHTLRENAISRSFYEKLGGVVVLETSWNGVPSVWYGWNRLPAAP